MRKPNTICQVCGQCFYKRPGQKLKSKLNFCSRLCRARNGPKMYMKELENSILFVDVVTKSRSFSDVCRSMNIPINGNSMYHVRNLIDKLKCNVDHFDHGQSKRFKYEIVEKICPVCKKVFVVSSGSKKEKTTCSKACSNTFFRSGPNHPNWSDDAYRTTCFLFHEKACVICGEHKIVEVHHLDKNSKNNSPENLIPMCPTHHQYMHSRYTSQCILKLNSYVEEFKNKHNLGVA